jgi:hypothetical protein
MNTIENRQQIQSYLDQLSPEKLVVAIDFLAYLVNQQDNEATEELLKISGFKQAFHQAQENIKQGKVISCDQLKRKY